MFNNDILNALKKYTESMQNQVAFIVETGSHPKRDELITFLTNFASVSPNISVEEKDVEDSSHLRSPISFYLAKEGEDTGIRFSGIPSGHEFNSLVLAVLQASGTAIKIDEQLQNIIRKIDTAMHFEVFISLSCHNCPEVVQALNQFALINPLISTEMIDGGLYPELIAERDIQGVPSVYLNGELFANGKVDPAQLIDTLIKANPDLMIDTESSSLPLQDVVVIGGGPAGISAAIYSARKGLEVTLIADRIGGQVKDTQGIENLISVPYTTGTELTNALQSHLDANDITLKQQLSVTQVSQGKIKELRLSSGEVIKTKALIVATGAKWRELGVPGEKENIGNGVAYCPHCDGPFYKGKDVAVIGGGNSGVEAALDLSGIVNSVTVFEFMPTLKADKVLVDKAKEKANISILTNVAVNEIQSEQGKVSAIEYLDRSSNNLQTKHLQGVFVQIGLVPNSGFLEGVVETTSHGEIVIDAKGKTSSAGIFACGDVTTVPYKQIVIAMGEGAKAALSAFEYLMMDS